MSILGKKEKLIQYPGKAREYTSLVFGEQVLEADGKRFIVKFEQVCQMADQDLDKLMSKMFYLFVKKKVVWGIYKDLFLAYDTTENQQNLECQCLKLQLLLIVGRYLMRPVTL